MSGFAEENYVELDFFSLLLFEVCVLLRKHVQLSYM